MGAITGTAAGHPNIRATHGKTLELTREAEIGARATCVVGVATRLDEEALAELHGRVELTLAAGGETVHVRGRLNPAFRPGDPLVVRRAPDVARNAVVVGADRAAADVARSFVAAAASEARIAVRVEELAHETAPGVLVVAPAPAPASGAPAEDLGQVRGHIRPKDGPVLRTDPNSVTRALQEGQRVTLCVDLATDAEARTAIAQAHAAGHTVLPAPTLSLNDAVLAVAGIANAELQMDGAELRPREAELDARTALIANAPADRVPKWLRKATRSGHTRGVIGLDLGTEREQFVSWRAGEAVEVPGARGRTATLVLVQD
ncbi:MAG TPA: DUF371 domain-containing protein [Thermoleophilaceae bacterium]|jgi:hypothetical protein